MAKVNMRQLAADVAAAAPGSDSIAKIQKVLKLFMGYLILFTDKEIMDLVKKYREKK